MKIGSELHKELFCRDFMDTYLEYEPEKLPWPALDSVSLERLKGIPFWRKAFETESNAGVLVSAYAETVSDPLIRDAIALQGKEETRHSRLIKTLIDHYQIEVEPLSAFEFPKNLEGDFTEFGFDECLDSFFAFGLFAIAREAQFLPEAFFTIFDPLLDEEARHIVFFVNWLTYEQINRGWGFIGFRAAKTLWYYGKALGNVLDAVRSSNTSGAGFTGTNASSFDMDLTLEKFLAVCLAENGRRMNRYEPRLLQPMLMPRLANLVLRAVQLWPKGKAQPQTVSATEN